MRRAPGKMIGGEGRTEEREEKEEMMVAREEKEEMMVATGRS